MSNIGTVLWIENTLFNDTKRDAFDFQASATEDIQKVRFFRFLSFLFLRKLREIRDTAIQLKRFCLQCPIE